jgi:hypothetical protein
MPIINSARMAGMGSPKTNLVASSAPMGVTSCISLPHARRFMATEPA